MPNRRRNAGSRLYGRNANQRLTRSSLARLVPGPGRRSPNRTKLNKSADSSKVRARNGGDDGTRTRDLCRDRAAMRCN